MRMLIVPYIEIEGRTLFGRMRSPREFSELAARLSDHFEKLYLLDIDGVKKNRPQLDVAQKVCDEIPTFYEGGVRFANNVIDMLITGAERAVIGTATLASFEELKGAFKLSENITLKVDYRDGIVSFDPYIAGRAFLDLSRDVRELGISELFVPVSLAKDAAAAKRELGFTLGVFAGLDERPSLEPLGVDYLVCEDFGRLMGHE